MATTAELINMLRQRCATANQKDVARELGVSDAMLSQILSGKRQIGPRVAARLGYRKIVQWETLHAANNGA